jgi:hypothetical protein
LQFVKSKLTQHGRNLQSNALHVGVVRFSFPRSPFLAASAAIEEGRPARRADGEVSSNRVSASCEFGHFIILTTAVTTKIRRQKFQHHILAINPNLNLVPNSATSKLKLKVPFEI